MDQIKIVYQDDSLIVINKPPGLLTVPGLSSPINALDLVKCEFPNSRVVHRLDMATSGLIIFPQNHQSLRFLGKLFEQRKIYKQYTAVVSGLVEASSGDIAIPLLCDWVNRPKQKADFIYGKPAQTRFKVVERNLNANNTRLTLEPHTGRSHQLRVHLQQIGHAIIGDPFYSTTIHNTSPCSLIKPQTKHSRMLLHATELRFEHPTRHNTISLHCAPDF
ncbi:tRNA pseudouridine32 synthase / 23S rRNA pseudouridine746 synthase [Alteromonadaceae bacterium 2753L.S.0a.02]|nr:tRNA pseudouridine32 synthase / 23S rRNA pseudouridine746 synthase [Alteromonadaceae bacterium 2753L.S.0a.02]